MEGRTGGWVGVVQGGYFWFYTFQVFLHFSNKLFYVEKRKGHRKQGQNVSNPTPICSMILDRSLPLSEAWFLFSSIKWEKTKCQVHRIVWRLEWDRSWECTWQSVSRRLSVSIVSPGTGRGLWLSTRSPPPSLPFLSQKVFSKSSGSLFPQGWVGWVWLKGMGRIHQLWLFAVQGGPLDASTCCLCLAHSRCSLNEWMIKCEWEKEIQPSLMSVSLSVK